MRHLIIILILALSAPAATLVSKATGNFTAAGSWGVGEAGASAIQATFSANTNTTTAYVYSSAFTCTNLDVIDGILVYGRRLGTTGTVSVALSDDNGVTATRELAINASDMDDDNNLHFFLFGSTLTCDGGADYKVGVKSSTSAQATFYRDGTAGNWFRVPRTTATAAPGAADIMFITGDLTGPATGNSFTVTMDNTAATVFGSVSAPQSIGIGMRGNMTWGVAAATNYLLTVAGVIEVWGSGIYNQGTSGARCPSDSTCNLNFDLTTNVDSGLICENGATCNVYAATKAITKTLLNTDEAAASTVIGVASTSGWAVNDVICFASTSRTAAESECKTILTVDSGVQVTLTAGLTNAHSGTAPTQAEVINITRNSVIQGESDSLQGFVRCAATAVCAFDYVEFYRLGSATANKVGINLLTTTGSATISNSSIHDFIVTGSVGVAVTGSAANNFTLTNNVMYNTAQQGFQVNTTTGSAWSLTGNTAILCGTSSPNAAFTVLDLGGTITGNTVAGARSDGFYSTYTGTIGTFGPNVAHSGAGTGFRFPAVLATKSTLTDLTAWRNSGTGVYIGGNGMVVSDLTIDGYTGFGNNGSNLQFDGAMVGAILKDLVLSGDTTFATANGMYFNSELVQQITVSNSTFGVVSGIKAAHTNDVNFSSAAFSPQFVFDNVNLASATQFTPFATLAQTRHISMRFQKYGQTANDHRTFYPHGNIRIDTTTVRASLPSQQVAPTNATIKLESGPWRIPVLNGATVAASAWVRKSTAADSCGANYNGAELRLILRANSAAGIASDTVLDTSTVAIGNWEQLSATTAAAAENATFEFFVDGDGTAGCYYVESGLYWFEGLPNPSGVGGGGAAGGGASGFIAQAARPR